MNSPCARILVFESVPKAARSSFFLGTGEKGNRGEGSETRAGVRERTEWAKALRLPSKTAADTETGNRPAHHHESSNHRGGAFWIFYEAVPVDYISYVTGICSVAVL